MSKEFEPFVPASATMKEFTPIPLIMGCILGILFGASSLYLTLKVGMTVSASIPVAVMSITIFKAFSKIFGVRQATILENNIVQTTGSAGESIAFGIAVTMPALLILGFNMELSGILLVAVLGSILGVLMMIPLRKALIVDEHHILTYPEGTACAEVLIVGEKGGTSARTVFAGFFVGLLYKFLNVGAKLWPDIPEKIFSWFKGGAVASEISPELLGVGYIIGPRLSCVMVGGGILSSWVLIPAIMLFGGGLQEPLFPATKLISEMSIHEIWRNYILYIGAGAVTAGGIISLIQSLPSIVKAASSGLRSLKKSGVKADVAKRTERDIPIHFVIIGSIALVIAITLAPSLKMNAMGGILIVVLGFLFVTVSSRLTGLVGSSSCPVSGMTVATLLITSLVFLMLGWVSPEYRVAALSVAAIVCVAASNGGTTSQDLKTGFLVGATPRAQQIGLLIGAITSALVIGYSLELLNNASTVFSKKDLPTTKIADVASLTRMERLHGPEGAKDKNKYHVLHLSDTAKEGPYANIPMGKYLVDDTGTIQYLVDPGINGALKQRDDGSSVQKYDAPKARLMSLIIDGILSQKLPWGLVLLGVAIALVLEISGIPTLAFAVGVYLPLSSTTPIFVGGMIRWFVDRKMRAKEEDMESSPGVLLSSGLIAGGAICGILLAFTSVWEGLGEYLGIGSKIPFISGSNITGMLMFGLMVFFVYLVGIGKIGKKKI